MSTYTHATALQPRATYLYEKSNIINISAGGRKFSAIMAVAAFSIAGMTKRPLIKKLFRLTGGVMLYRSLSGNCPISALTKKAQTTDKHAPAVNIRTSILINQQREVVRRCWQDIENLPVFMTHLKSVRVEDEKKSHWRIKTLPGVPTVEWDAEVLENNMDTLSWRSLPGSMIETAGKIIFEDWGNNTTQVDITITYRPPAGYIGTAIAALFKTPFIEIVKQDAENFKHYIEEGRVITEIIVERLQP